MKKRNNEEWSDRRDGKESNGTKNVTHQKNETGLESPKTLHYNKVGTQDEEEMNEVGDDR